MHNPVDEGRKLNVSKTLRMRPSSERLMYVQFTSCVHVKTGSNLDKKLTDDLKPWVISIEITALTNLTSNQKENSKSKINNKNI